MKDVLMSIQRDKIRPELALLHAAHREIVKPDDVSTEKGGLKLK